MKQKKFFITIFIIFFLTSLSSSFSTSSAAPLSHTVPFAGLASLKILKVSPSTLEGLINIDVSFSAEFNRDLDANTVDAKFVSLSGNGSPVPVEVKYIKSAKTVSVKPLKKLAYDSEYRLVFKTGLADKTGKRLPSAMMYQYYTASSPDRPAIKVSSVFPENGSGIVEEKPLIYAAFDQKMALVKGADLTEHISLYQNRDKIPIEVSYNHSAMRLEARPLVALKGGLSYRIMLSRKIEGVNGKCLAETYTWSFGVSKVLFFLKYSYPNAKVREINSFDRILLTFSESISPRTSFDDFINISDDSDRVIPGKYHVYGPASVIFIPEFPFYSGTYKIFISKDFKSLHANDIMKDVKIPFTVKSDHFNSGEFSNEKK